MRTLIALALLGGLAACGGPSANVWACAGQPDLLVTENGAGLTILNVNNGESVTLPEVEEGKAWARGPVSWRIVALDQALYQTGSSAINCRRPG